MSETEKDKVSSALFSFIFNTKFIIIFYFILFVVVYSSFHLISACALSCLFQLYL
jgi:hypothetical protein